MCLLLMRCLAEIYKMSHCPNNLRLLILGELDMLENFDERTATNWWQKYKIKREKKSNNDDNYGAVIWSVQPCRWQGSHYLVFPQFLVAEKNRINPCTVSLAPIISTKEILREHGAAPYSTGMDLSKKMGAAGGERSPIFTAFSWHLRFCRGG